MQLFISRFLDSNHAHGMQVYLYMDDILFKDYDSHVKRGGGKSPLNGVLPAATSASSVRELAPLFSTRVHIW